MIPPRPNDVGSANAARFTDRDGRVLLAGVLVCFFFALTLAAGAAELTPAPNAPIEAGRLLARVHCATCHLFPEPDLLDRKTWAEHTLGRMKFRMGLAPESLIKYPDAARIKASGAIPAVPTCTQEQFQKIAAYYLAEAPPSPLPQAPRVAVQTDLPGFRFEAPSFRLDPPSTTLVHISRSSQRIYVGDEETQSLQLLDSNGQRLATVDLGNVVVALTETSRGLYLSMIGSFLPSEKPLGGLTFFERTGQTFRPGRIFFKETPRFTHAEFADLNQDGKTDIAVSCFGYFTGRFAWYESLGQEQFREHILFPKSGAVRSVARDFTGDGRKDLAVLIAQETEALQLFVNEGQGKFSSRLLFQKAPIYGHTYFEVVDFDRDGRDDFLVTNGDNGEYVSPHKRYHGIRLYLNRGDLRFEESWFFPLHGAFKAMARDFDGDGDLDIAAISFFPDYSRSPNEGFVYLRNDGQLRFQAFTFREVLVGRWLTMDAEDLDADGDMDLVLGSYIRGPSDVPEPIAQAWEQSGPSVVILRNQKRSGGIVAPPKTRP